jgi:phosphomannomutase
MSINWNSIVKAYDVRGLVGIDLTAEVVEAIAAAYVDVIGLAGHNVVIGHDMRVSSPEFAAAFCAGVTARGANAIMLGLCSTDECYFASGQLNSASAMFTASHNSSAYNGIKLSRAGARAISLETGLADIRELAAEYLEHGFEAAQSPGTTSSHSPLRDYANFLRQMVDLSNIRPLRVVVDAANSMGGHTTPAVLANAAGLGRLPIEIIELYFELDGTFPNHDPNPLDAKNLVDLQAAVVLHQADLGIAFDGDADRCFVVDELGQLVSPSTIAAIVAVREIERVKAIGENEPKVLYGHLTSRRFAETALAHGAQVDRTRVGHSFIKTQMAQTNAVFGAEHSAHYYFRDFWFADSGMLAAMHVMKALGSNNQTMSALAASYPSFPSSGEINRVVQDVKAVIARVESVFAQRDAVIEAFDGLTVSSTSASGDWWWFNLRSSNTEPVLRFNAEAQSQAMLKQIMGDVLAVIQS